MKTKTRRKQPLTDKQEAFIEKVNMGVTPTRAAEELYRTKNKRSASVIASRLTKHPVIFGTVKDALESEGSKTRAEDIAKAIEDGLHADKVIITKKGDQIVVPDHKVRLFAAQLATKIRGELQDIVIDTAPKDIRVSFTLIKARSPEEVARISAGSPLEGMQRLPQLTG